jgi:CRP/FNR family transcriptional regulator, cyclic AMP receptor protein
MEPCTASCEHVGMRLPNDPALAAALALSPLRALPQETVERLIADAVILDVPRGGVPQRQGDDTPAPGLMLSGLLRAFHTTADGRQLTTRYARSGSLLAIATIYMKRSGMLGQQALTPCRILRFRSDTALELAAHDPQVSYIFAEENARRLFQALDELAGNVFGTMRQRLVRHLLDLAATDKRGDTPLVARLSQQALADAIGSVREVVVRLLRELREEELIRTSRDEIELLQPDRLHAETFPRET